MLLDHKDEWLAARLEDLDYGYIDGIAAAARAYPLEGVKKDEVEKELGYFLNNAPRMRYHRFRSRGLFTGSGVCARCSGSRTATTSPPTTAPPRSGVLRRAEGLPAVAARQPQAQPRDPYGRNQPDPA
jgi:hypothetical protein